MTHFGVIASSYYTPPFAVSSLTTMTNAAAASSLTTGTLSPSANSLLVVSWSGRNSNVNATASSSFSGTWTQVRARDLGKMSYLIAYMQLGSSPGTGTVTVQSNATSRITMRVCQVTGHNTSAPVTQSKTFVTSGSTVTSPQTLTFNSTPASSSLIIAGHATDIGPTLDPDFTIIGAVINSNGTSPSRQILGYDVGSPATTVDVTFSGGGSQFVEAAAIEIAAP